MTLSWSHKLFFRMNAQVGKRPWLDACMFFCAHWLIFLMFGLAFALSRAPHKSYAMGELMLLFYLVPATVGALIVSWIISFIWKHPRPIVEHPEITVLLKTRQTFKSFPSDHTMMSWMLALFVAMLPESFIGFPYVPILFVCCASLVSVGRVYVGVHYPRDIIGGMILAIIASSILHKIIFTFF